MQSSRAVWPNRNSRWGSCLNQRCWKQVLRLDHEMGQLEIKLKKVRRLGDATSSRRKPDLLHCQGNFRGLHENFPGRSAIQIGSHQGSDADVDPDHIRVGPGVVGIESIYEAVALPAPAFEVVPNAMQHLQTLLG